MSLSKLFYLLFVTLNLSLVQGGSSKIQKQPPSITFQWWLPDGENNKWLLIGDLPEAAKNEIFVDEGNDTFTFGDSALGLSINCSAPYPVEWVPQLHKGLMENGLFAIISGSDISFIREFGDINDPSTYKYTSLVKVTRSFKELTGNYSCQSLDGDPRLRRTIFVYVEGENRVQTLILAGKKLEISLEDERTIIFPCSASSPREEVQLQKLVQTNEGVMDYEQWSPVVQKEAVVYDPKIGFTIQVHQLSPAEILGSYRCRGITDEDVVFIDITVSRKHEQRNELGSNLWKAYVQAPASLDYKSVQHDTGIVLANVTCCSNSLRPPSAIGLPCFSVNHCLLFDFVESKTTTDRVVSKAFGVSKLNNSCISLRAQMIYTRVICKGDGVDVDSILAQTYPTSTLADGKPIKTAELVSDSSSKNVADFKTAMIFITNNPHPKNPIARNNYRRLSDGYTLQVYSNQIITLVCSCFNFGLAYGATSSWSVNNHYDGSQTFVPNPPIGNDVYIRLRQTLGTAVSFLPTSSNSTKKAAKSVSCHCPFAKDPGWSKITVAINLTESTRPSVTLLGEPEVYWAMNSTDKVIQCQVSGSPIPDVFWQKDGKKIEIRSTSRVWNASYSKENGIATLQFKKVSTSTHGLYTCVAKNFVGTASSSVNLYVEGAHSTVVYWVSAILIVSACFLLGVVILKTRKSAQNNSHKNVD